MTSADLFVYFWEDQNQKWYKLSTAWLKRLKTLPYYLLHLLYIAHQKNEFLLKQLYVLKCVVKWWIFLILVLHLNTSWHLIYIHLLVIVLSWPWTRHICWFQLGALAKNKLIFENNRTCFKVWETRSLSPGAATPTNIQG